MDQAQLNALLEETRQTLRQAGIPVSKKIDPNLRVNTRAKRRLGCCYFVQGGHIIEISAALLDQPELLHETLVHELLHTCPGCRDHGERWKAYAQQVNHALGLHIQRTAPAGENAAPLRHEEVKYILECQSCGAKIQRMRMSKAVKQPWRYRCQCGGKLKRIR